MKTNVYTLITGASEGFGKALAIECASRKMNLILVALPGTGLNCFVEMLKQKYAIEAVGIEMDLSVDGNCNLVFQTIKNKKLAVNMLINNVGIGSTMLFEEGSIEFFQRQIKINIMTTTVMTYLFLQDLKKHSPGYILNVGSLSCFFYLMKKQVYGATKSYVYSFSKSLRRELDSELINVSVICPGPMNTNKTVTAINESFNWLTRMSTMNPEEVAPIAIEGLLKRKEVIVPGKLNKLFLFFDMMIPSFLKDFLTGLQMRNIQSVTSMENNLCKN
ncbi:hypothetical protein FLJC2902T_06480 [Flavobacterium limnosediminis JC2902]|uniref:Short-chain dehydrogenase n=1 Tax=Flavobacterium limnosediminis JC2902 TaxID=1341181 RepID=V6SSV9_9FLAO|nr:SDR family NAD(P)-dependent oxidoreductase [Flavobacterium limnosediminis]ESU29252.1 hypothetical protein FLJC2902T_06480 [Flavobacterium limnosediminis JC2902]